MTIHFSYNLKYFSLDCEMEYESGERSTDVMPGYSSSAYVEKVSLNGVDITDIVSESVMDQISDEFLQQYENEEDQYEPDYESMLER